ncbi:tetratricopeptide repeat protein [Gelidibacter gilvus]|uniref:Tetratricopeptide repeat protein n=1 Tax=Gelidibacter gilvus TaxID=59602 RepID=A0A4Q0XIK5_9FLAO|nr:tetratricopeptide repeat protein [Gelidibacter gilvus]RXJ51454.1 tetratricopeptide repeat protein [Gelidibacter gilvus]
MVFTTKDQPSILKSTHLLSLVLFILSHLAVTAQEPISSDKAYENYQQLSATMAKSFPEDAIKTYRRTSYTEQQLETYLSQHFQRLDLLPLIKDRPAFVIDAYLHSGNWFRAIGLIKESVESYKCFFKYYEAHRHKLTPKQINDYVPMVSFAHGHLADNYAQLNYIDSAATQHERNIKFNDTLSIISYPSAINNYGLFYYWTKRDLDSALYYFKKAYAITQNQFPQHSLLASIRDNIADVYTEQNRPSEAEALYAMNFEFYKTTIIEPTGTRDFARLISAGSQLVQTNLSLENLSEAQKVFSQLDSIILDAESHKEFLPASKLEYLLVKENLYKAQNDIPKAYSTLAYRALFSDSLSKVARQQDSQWRDELNSITVDRVALNFELDRMAKENKIKSQKATLWMISLISLVCIILLLSLFLGRRQHLLNAKNRELLAEQQLENAQLKMDQLNSEIQSKQRDLSDFALNLTQNQQWAEMLAAKIKLLKSGDHKDTATILEQLEQAIQNKVQFDNDSLVFYERLDKLNDAFYSHLTSMFPNLSKNEIRLCSMIRLKMESNHIATLQNITLASLNTSRYRMRKKMQLGDDVHLDEFIQQL